ncbi:FliH/SctL family protein [Geothrix sp. 21YS21S-4]|uniref:FliH/SctL family protein n=1 Tax=Geothrix sp. 21YS21S-4 TaxID=3068889 RepID=UPI0027BAE4D6|nr:FliH/SctL family protein [Geothrix sp. 21YS21S-4]
MSRKGFIASEDLQHTRLEAFPYFPVDAMPAPRAPGEEEGSVAAELGDDAASRIPVEQRIVDRLQEAERQAQEIARKAYEEGFASGEAEGRTYGESQYRTYVQRLSEHLEDLSKATLTLREALNDDLVALALAVGEHLAVQQINRSPAAVRALMEGVLEELPFPLPHGRQEGTAPLQVFLNPMDLDLLADRFVGHGGLTLLPDPGLARGSLRAETPQGILNGSLEGRRERLMQLIARMRESQAP